jgi:gas vesicle protein
MKSSTATGLIAGLVVGAVLGIIFAPKKGDETRDILKKKAANATDKAKDLIKRAKKSISGDGEGWDN